MYTEQKFNIPELKGISKKSVDEHLKLYAGYVKHSNLIIEKISEYAKDSEKNAYVLGELQRRFGFEFDGMRNHEYYFKSLEDGAQGLGSDSALKKQVVKQWGSFEAFFSMFKAIALMRGIGWAIMYWDKEMKQLTLAWVEEQHLGHLNSLQYVLGIDMWEHSYYMDYGTAKAKYVEAFFENINWKNIENFFSYAQK
jgi:Fe-Mn family superoxide dismutase